MNFKTLFILTMYILSSYQMAAKNLPGRMWWEHNYSNYCDQFERWWGDINAPSRVFMRNEIICNNYKNILDVGCGFATDLQGIRFYNLPVVYTGVDITPSFISRAQLLKMNVSLADAHCLMFGDKSFDIVYARHLFEHEPDFKDIISEFIRVARHEILIIFYKKLVHTPTYAELTVTNYEPLWDVSYNVEDVLNACAAHDRVTNISLHNIGDFEQALIVKLS